MRAICLCLLLAAPAFGQDGAEADPAAALGVGQGEVAISAVEFGLGEVVRPGSWAGIRLSVIDRGVRQRELLIRVEMKDADGDTTLFERGLASNPGQRQEIWTYVRLPFRFTSGDRLSVRAYEAEMTEAAVPRAGRMVGEVLLSPTGVAPPEAGFIGVIGARTAGLTAYAESPMKAYDSRLHEPTVVALRLVPSTMPDAWPGLSVYDALVWTQGEPVTLGAERADTIRRWVRGGGHLVVVMPSVGGAWLSGEVNNPLHDIMPLVRAERRADYPIGPIRPLLTVRADAVLPATVVAHTFEPRSEAAAEDALVVLADPDGRALVVRRQVGLGQVTLVGIDLGDPALTRVGVPSAAAFWHRVLGRRGDLTPWAARGQQVREPDRVVRHFDHSIDSAIAATGNPASGVLLGFVVFILYWLVAGPVGFALLKRAGYARHAWVAFVGVTGLFTAIAWGGAALLSPGSVRGAHLTIIDHVYGQDVQRTRTWMGLIVPRYGEATLRVGDDDARALVATIAPWTSPDPAVGLGSFPDNRGYRILAGRPDTMRFPVRSTMKEVVAQWVGPTVWTMPLPVDATGRPQTLAATPRPAGLGGQEVTSEARGGLVHDLPGALHDVLVIVNHGMLRVQPGISPNRPIMQASAFRLGEPWRAGERLDLSQATARTGNDDVSLASLLDQRTTPQLQRGLTGGLSTDARSVSEQLAIAGLLSQAGPPPTQRGFMANDFGAATRRAMHGMDLGVWMTRPCIIVIGHLGVGPGEGGAPSPTPLTIDGRPPDLRGRTVVRWVYPLGAAPPPVLTSRAEPDQADEAMAPGELAPGGSGPGQ